MLLLRAPHPEAGLAALMLADELVAIEDHDARGVLPHLEVTTEERCGDGVAVPMEVDVALHIDAALVDVHDLGHMKWEGSKRGSLFQR